MAAKLKRCRACKTMFEPWRFAQVACGPKCAVEVAKLNTRRKLAREKRAGRIAMRRRRDWVKLAQEAFNAFIRARDEGKPCVCCGKYPTSVEHAIRGHSWDAGHYRSIGAAPHLRFHEDNCHRQRVQCNRDRSGNAVEYRRFLIARIGLERVEALENDNAIRRFTVDELKSVIALYRSKLRELRKVAA